MKRPLLQTLLTSLLAITTPHFAPADAHVHRDAVGTSAAEAPPKLLNETLLMAELEGAEGTEVVVSRVTIPPHTALPKHWHPGEEFAYLIEGSVTLWQEGKPDITVHAGEAVKIPLKQVHTAMTTDEAATAIVFRVHEQGQPESIPAN